MEVREGVTTSTTGIEVLPIDLAKIAIDGLDPARVIESARVVATERVDVQQTGSGQRLHGLEL